MSKKIARLLKPLLISVLVLVLVLGAVSVSALTFNGTSSDSTYNDTAAGGSYAIASSMTVGNRPVGYRFTLVDTNGFPIYKNDTGPVDVFRDSLCQSDGRCYAGGDFHKFDHKICG